MKRTPRWVQKVKKALAGQKIRRQARYYGGFETNPLVLPGSPEFPRKTRKEKA